MYVAETKALIICVVTAQLICTFVFAYAKNSFSNDVAQIFCYLLCVNRVFLSRVRNLYHMLKTLVGQCCIYLRAKCTLIYD